MTENIALMSQTPYLSCASLCDTFDFVDLKSHIRCHTFDMVDNAQTGVND